MVETVRSSSENHAGGLLTRPSAAAAMKLRGLPDGDFQKGLDPIWKGRVVTVDVQNQGLPVGALVEMECGTMTFLGELQYRSGSTHVILVEHSLDRAKLESVDDSWG
jgi:hypothetical protein